MRQEQGGDLLRLVQETAQAAAANVDVLLVEGGASLREGYTFGLPTPAVAQALESPVLVVVKYRERVRFLDDTLASAARLGSHMIGILINRVPEDASQFITQEAVPYLQKRGVAVFGIIPERRDLGALTVDDLVHALDAQILTPKYKPTALVETLTVGAMTADTALSRFRQQLNKAVITGGDRTDIQLAALETSTTCLVLTGNLHPSPLIVKQAEEFGVAILLVRTNTMETIEAIERVFGKTRLAQPSKLKQFEELVRAHVDLGKLYKAIGIA
jgi:hypothetical protein